MYAKLSNTLELSKLVVLKSRVNTASMLDLNQGVIALRILTVLPTFTQNMMMRAPSGETNNWYTDAEPTKLCVPTTTWDSVTNS